LAVIVLAALLSYISVIKVGYAGWSLSQTAYWPLRLAIGHWSPLALAGFTQLAVTRRLAVGIIRRWLALRWSLFTRVCRHVHAMGMVVNKGSHHVNTPSS